MVHCEHAPGVTDTRDGLPERKASSASRNRGRTGRRREGTAPVAYIKHSRCGRDEGGGGYNSELEGLVAQSGLKLTIFIQCNQYAWQIRARHGWKRKRPVIHTVGLELCVFFSSMGAPLVSSLALLEVPLILSMIAD
jgi:hypothetical protein